jgi:predicted transposase/invertase (TIGR01784 family)
MRIGQNILKSRVVRQKIPATNNQACLDGAQSMLQLSQPLPGNKESRLMLVKRSKFLDPKSDIVFKKIFGQHPELIKSFLNGILPLSKGRLIESVEYLTPEQSPRIPSMKNTIVDVKCRDQAGRIFIVEMQMTWSKSFLKRFLFGTSKAYVQQLDKGKHYDNLCPVYGVALVNTEFEDATEDWFHHYRMTNTKDIDKTLEGLELVFFELPKFNPKTFEHRKLGVLWMRFLRETEKLEDIPEEFQNTPEVAMAMELAQEAAYTAEELEAYDEYLDAVRVEGTVRADSLEEGEQIGIQKGREVEKQNIARMMFQEGMDIQKISKITGVPEEKIKSRDP